MRATRWTPAARRWVSQGLNPSYRFAGYSLLGVRFRSASQAGVLLDLLQAPAGLSFLHECVDLMQAFLASFGNGDRHVFEPPFAVENPRVLHGIRHLEQGRLVGGVDIDLAA